jgi:hypothetical protein
MDHSHPFTTSAQEPALRFFLARGKVGMPDCDACVRTAAGMALLLGAPPLVARALSRLGAREHQHRLERWWARRVLRYLDVRLDLDGLELVDPGASYVVTPLHEGFADAPALLHLPLPLRFVVRDELLGWPLLGPYLRGTRQIAIRPEQGARLPRAAAPVGRGRVAGREHRGVSPGDDPGDRDRLHGRGVRPGSRA